VSVLETDEIIQRNFWQMAYRLKTLKQFLQSSSSIAY